MLVGCVHGGQHCDAPHSGGCALLHRGEYSATSRDHDGQLGLCRQVLETWIDWDPEGVRLSVRVDDDHRTLKSAAGECGERLMAKASGLGGGAEDSDRLRMEHRIDGAAFSKQVVSWVANEARHRSACMCSIHTALHKGHS